jgi:hypothetical protein
MSMIDAIPLLVASGADGGYQISRSVRTRSSASAYFSRTLITPTNNKIWTWSAWVKRGTLGAAQTLFSGQVDTNNWGIIAFLSGDTLSFQQADAASVTSTVTTTQVFRDSSAWYHIIVVFDSTQATAANRLKMYVNGVQVTAFGTATYLAQNTASRINTAVAHQISRYISAAQYFDGYMTEVNFIDGQALTPSSFGETNPITGVWQPKRYAGTYGTNGFYLPFSDNSGADSFGIGADKSANALNRVELGNTSVGYTILGTMTFTLAGAAQVHLRDNNSTTAAADPAGLTTNTALGYDFGRAIKVRRIATLTAAANGTSVSSIFNIQYSDDNVTWTTVTGSATTHTFSAGLSQSNTTDIDDNGSHRYWRLKYLSGTTAGNFWIATLDMYINDIGPNSWFSVNISTTAGTTYDSMLDVPTLYDDGGNGRGNYCTLNPLDFNSGTVSNGNLQWVTSAGAGNGCFGTFAFDVADSTNKYYWEMTLTSGDCVFGIVPLTTLPSNTARPGSYSYYTNGNKYSGTSASGYGAAFTSGDVIGVAVGAGIITFYKNGISQGSAFTGLTGFFKPAIWEVSGTFNANFGQRPFAYTPPTGFKALNTQNLPDAPVKKGNQHFNTLLYTANVAGGKTMSGLAFQPDLIWIKNRDNVEQHYWQDAVRGFGGAGTTKMLKSNSTDAEATVGADVTFAVTSDGFTITDTNYSGGELYFNGRTYASWNWYAGGSTVTNTSGSISSQVRANPTAGFSVVTWTSTGANATVGHGLGIAPKMVIVKGRSVVSQWFTWHTSLTSGAYALILNLIDAQASYPTVFNSTTPTSNVFSVGTSLTNGTTAVAYCFAEVAGYSAFGKYTGNGSADGPFVYCGFRPRYVLVKRSDSTGNWFVWDSARDPYNTVLRELYADATGAEYTRSGSSDSLDLLSNGFKIRLSSTYADRNASGGTYIYAAFAENPFKHSLAR